MGAEAIGMWFIIFIDSMNFDLLSSSYVISFEFGFSVVNFSPFNFFLFFIIYKITNIPTATNDIGTNITAKYKPFFSHLLLSSLKVSKAEQLSVAALPQVYLAKMAKPPRSIH